MKRFLVFAGDAYYPAGGMQDFVGDFDTLAEAKAHAVATPSDWGQVCDTQKRTLYTLHPAGWALEPM